MFNKVIVAEDFDSISITVIKALEELSIQEIHYAKYCDDAF
jgi:two-component system capsular synthesis response regulator RcsB